MRIDRIALRGFLSHSATDWSPNGARLVTLVGPNGAGKSSLLDAVQYALFDSARGRTDDLVRLGSSDMSATVEFEFAGERYRVTRGRTTRSGGKSYLELAIADGDTWRPLTGDTIRDTQARIEELLRLDAATFGTAVLLGQGQAARFAEATPAERKRVLGVILGLDRYERAEVKARETARTLEAAVAAERGRIDALEARIATLADVDARLAAADAALADNGTATKAATRQRTDAEGALRDLAAAIAAVEAAEADVARIEAELAGHKERWRRADESRKRALDAQERHCARLAGVGEVEDALGKLEHARADVAALEATERRQQERRRELEEAQRVLRELEAERERATAEHTAHRRLLADRLATLKEQVASLEPVTCPECGARFAADAAGFAERLRAADVELERFGPPAAEPMALARARAKVKRAETRLAEAAFDADELVARRRALLALERTAAAAGEMEAHRAGLADAEAQLASAVAELAAIERDGKAARQALTVAQAKVAEGEAVRARRAEAQARHDAAADALRTLEMTRAELTEARARAQAQAEQRDALVGERDQVQASIEGAEVAIARERRLVTAFGRDGIPARIIEGTLPELTGYVDELLGELRPGMTLSIRAQRAKKSGAGTVEALDLVVRDAAGERPLALFSGGERMSVSLAIAVGLSRLVARRAGSRIATLIVDEPDGLDADSRRALGHALKVLSHHGDLERIVVVTHTPDLAEFGDAVYQVVKGDAGSVVELAA